MRREEREEEVQKLKDERGQDWERGECILQEFVVKKVYTLFSNLEFSKFRGYCMSKLFSKPRGCGVLNCSELFF